MQQEAYTTSPVSWGQIPPKPAIFLVDKVWWIKRVLVCGGFFLFFFLFEKVVEMH